MSTPSSPRGVPRGAPEFRGLLALIDEVYFRLLKDERSGTLVHLLQQCAQIQQVARAVERVHRNLSEQISAGELAAQVNMSSSGLHNKLKEVMHLSPLQYAKQTKLNRAQEHIWQGLSISQAGFLVGYNSPAQLSRKYKRRFGVSPSEDRTNWRIAEVQRVQKPRFELLHCVDNKSQR